MNIPEKLLNKLAVFNSMSLTFDFVYDIERINLARELLRTTGNAWSGPETPNELSLADLSAINCVDILMQLPEKTADQFKVIHNPGNVLVINYLKFLRGKLAPEWYDRYVSALFDKDIIDVNIINPILPNDFILTAITSSERMRKIAIEWIIASAAIEISRNHRGYPRDAIVSFNNMIYEYAIPLGIVEICKIVESEIK